ncbi:MAG: phage virion morphogenesis protein, partial [Mariprofundales bacterium]
LQLSGALRLNLAYNADNNGLEFGSNAIYAATHQFGADKGAFGSGVPWGDIPARPFLGFSDNDKDDIIDIIYDHILQAMN